VTGPSVRCGDLRRSASRRPATASRRERLTGMRSRTPAIVLHPRPSQLLPFLSESAVPRFVFRIFCAYVLVHQPWLFFEFSLLPCPNEDMRMREPPVASVQKRCVGGTLISICETEANQAKAQIQALNHLILILIFI
jgi:hypothetical protein